MRILVFSDTHGRTERMLDVIRETPHDMVVHLGDCVADARRIEAEFPDENLRYVAGNDLYDVMSRTPTRALFAAGRIAVMAVHGHDYSVRATMSKLYETAKSLSVALVLYGHTHVPRVDTHDGVTMFSPGSCSLDRSRTGNSWGLVEVEGEKVKCQIMYF